MKSKKNGADNEIHTLKTECAKQLVLRTLTKAVGVLEGMDFAGDHEGQPERQAHPRCIEYAKRSRDESVQDEAASAALELLKFVKNAPNESDAFVRIAFHGKLTQEDEQHFFGHIWVLLKQYAFLFGQHVQEHSRDPHDFLNRVADVLPITFEQRMTADQNCIYCHEPIEPIN